MALLEVVREGGVVGRVHTSDVHLVPLADHQISDLVAQGNATRQLALAVQQSHPHH